ncbi:hypothetical protein V6N13_114814 [Hibiscus sabdariffa]
MKNQILDQMIGVPVKSTMYQVERASRLYLQDAAGQYWIPSSAEDKGNFALKRMNKLGKKADAFIHGVHEHVKLVPKITKTVKGKLSLGARILQVGGVDKIFKQLFSVGEGEKLMEACQCYLSTTAVGKSVTLPAQTHILRTESSCTRSSGSQCNNELGSSKVLNAAYTTLSHR